MFIYYRGQNDAWKGYGGATVYTRERTLPEKYVPELREAAEAAGLDWNEFVLTDNSCPAKPARVGPFEELEEDLERVEEFASKEVDALERSVEPELKSFGRGFTVLEREVLEAEREVVREVADEERKVLEEVKKLYVEERSFFDKLFGRRK